MPINQKKQVEVVASIIEHNGKFLCVQRGPNKFDYISHKFEFPGGKVEKGETREQAVIREIQEELCMDITPKKAFLTVEHEYPDFSLIMHSFICFCENPAVTLTEHIDYKWLSQGELSGLDWAAADLPIVDKLLRS